jgi:hypothetical protein
MSNISAGTVSILALRLRLLLAAICKATTNESNHKEPMILRQGSCPKHEKPVCLKSFSCGGTERTEDAQRLFVRNIAGYLTHRLILNHMTIT